MAALRTALARHEGRILVFYSGSSRAGLNAMFHRQRAPLFAASMPLDLPILDRGFVASGAELLEQRAGVHAGVDAIERMLDRVLHTPEFLNEITLWLMVYALRGDAGELERAYTDWLVRLRETPIGHMLGARLAGHRRTRQAANLSARRKRRSKLCRYTS